ncbi:MAG TPA: hypothetical protein VGQ62_01140 [Chloroflexota bacterium]|jgi:serine/threonine protein phosphatase PrpC|nr:hypothetical protein [Chloroflexota bacterium]
MMLSFETPFGRPLQWAQVAMVSDPGDSHELNDDRCLVLTSQDLGDSIAPPMDEFMLCLLADGATGSTFGPRPAFEYGGESPKQAGWRASQLAQSAFVERFLDSPEIDIMDRLKDGLRAADRVLADSAEGTLSTTLVALFLSADGTAYAASIGDSVLLVLPPRRSTPGERRLKKLGYEDSTSVGSGETTLQSVDEGDLIEQWWPNKEGGTNTRLSPGTHLVLLSDGISDNLAGETIDQLLRRHPLDRATAALPVRTRARRLQAQKRDGGSTQQLGLDNMSAIVVRFDGFRRPATRHTSPPVDDATLICLQGTHGGPRQDAGGTFGLICMVSHEHDRPRTSALLRYFLESEHVAEIPERLAAGWQRATAQGSPPRLAIVAVDEQGVSHTFTAGGAQVERAS